MAVCIQAAQAAVLKGEFPCRIEALPYRPVLAFLGENHYNEFSAAVKEAAARGAAAGAYYAALEVGTDQRPLAAGPATPLVAGLGFAPEGARLYGLEASPATAFVGLWRQTSSRSDRPDVWNAEKAAEILDSIRESPGVRGAFLAILDRVRDKGAQRLIRQAAAGEPLLALPAEAETAALREAAVQARISALRIIKQRYNEPAVDEIVARLGQEADPAALRDALMIDIRDRDYALLVASLYCAAAGEGRNLAVVVGRSHVKGMSQILSRWSGGAIATREFATMTFAEAVAARELLRSWEAAAPAAALSALAPPKSLAPPKW